MLSMGVAHVPSPDRTHLIDSTDDEAVKCDVFRITYDTQDGINHEAIATLTIRGIAHPIQGKHYLSVGIYESMDEKVRSFIETYKDQVVVLTICEFDFETGAVRVKKSYSCMFESGLLPYMYDLPEKPATYELIFREI